MKHFDITFLEDLHAYRERDLGFAQLKILSFFIARNEDIVVERRAINALPAIIIVLNQNNFQDFLNHWTNLFNNL